MVAAKINPQHKPHSPRAAVSTSAVMKGLPISEVKRHANWSERSNTFEQYYVKPFGKHATNAHISNTAFSNTENLTTLTTALESSETVVGTDNNTTFDGDEGVNVVATRPWIRGGLVKTVLKNLFFIYLL
jgi:hypothetical protein